MKKQLPEGFSPSNLSVVNEELKLAITVKSKAGILQMYDYVEDFIDLENAPEEDFKNYNELVSAANEILYT